MIKDKENRDKMKCEWCGKYEYNSHMEHNFAGDLCCFDCIDEAKESTRLIKNCNDIARLKDYEAIDIILTLIVRHDIDWNELNDIYFENKRDRS